MIDDMHRSVIYFVRAAFREAEPRTVAMDAAAVPTLRKATRRLATRWKRKFSDESGDLSRWFVDNAANRCDKHLKFELEKRGFKVKFPKRGPSSDALKAAIAENVSLIRSIPEKHMREVEGLVMRMVQEGRGVKYLERALAKRYRITTRRARFIAKDQNQKVTSAAVRARQQELGADAIWIHTGIPKHPRPTHVANSGKVYDPVKGWPDPALRGKRIFPGSEPNCTCASATVMRIAA